MLSSISQRTATTLWYVIHMHQIKMKQEYKYVWSGLGGVLLPAEMVTLFPAGKGMRRAQWSMMLIVVTHTDVTFSTKLHCMMIAISGFL